MNCKHTLVLLIFCYLGTAHAFEIFPNTQEIDADIARDTSQPKLRGKVTLSLDEAILLAIRTNPNVQSSRLDYISQKFNLWIQEWQFDPHYSFQATALFNRNRALAQPFIGSHTYNVQPAVSVLTPIGTMVSLAGTNTQVDHYNPALSLQVMQPLMRGFGKAVVEASLNNARESEIVARLNIEGRLRSTVTDVINAYLDTVSAERTVAIDEEAMERAKTSVEQTKLFIKGGHKAGTELVTVEASVASAKLQLENDRNMLAQSRFALLAAIGLDPNTNVHFTSLNVEKLIHQYHFPSVIQTKKWVLENDIQYQTDNMMLHGQQSRTLLLAKDNTRWQLNLTASAATGGGSGGGYNSGTNSLFNGANQQRSIGLDLEVPIDDQASKQAVINAKIALKQAELALMQEKWSKETSAINGWNSVVSAERALRYAEDAEKLQEKTYHVSYQKYLHGLTDSLGWQSAQQSLKQAQQALLSARISYLKALVNLDLLVGNTLKTWQINVRLQ